MSPRRKREHRYMTTTIQIREDLFLIGKNRDWNNREILEKAQESLVTPEDRAYLENLFLERKMMKNKKIIEESNVPIEAKI